MNPELIDKIERYLNDEMEPQERTGFELQLQTDEALQNELQVYSKIDKTMKKDEISEQEKELARTLEKLNQKYILQGAKVRSGNFKKLLAAAAAVLVIVLGSVYFLSKETQSAEKLYAAYAEHPALQTQLRSNKADSLAGIAAEKFNTKNYYEALPLLQQYLQLQPEDIQMRFSEGICQLELDNFSDAENIFNAVAAGKTGYAEPAKWYLALTALKQKDIGKCRKQLKNIAKDSPYFTKAGELLKKLPD